MAREWSPQPRQLLESSTITQTPRVVRVKHEGKEEVGNASEDTLALADVSEDCLRAGNYAGVRIVWASLCYNNERSSDIAHHERMLDNAVGIVGGLSGKDDGSEQMKLEN